MRIPVIWTIVAAVVGVIAVIFVGSLLIQPDLPLVVEAGFDREGITPNADGDNDIATFSYELTRNARVSILLEDAGGQIYAFRDAQQRIAQKYNVQFSGVVDGYVLPGEQLGGTVMQRLIPDGNYTWRLRADAPDGETQEVSGTLSIRDADVPLPDITTFTISPSTFTPNQDGRADRVAINVYVAKPDADVRVVLLGEENSEIPISARKEGNINEDAQRYIFDYAGGVDLNADPPPDGTYEVVVTAQDEEGQIVRASSELTIRDGGKPFAEIVAQSTGVDVAFVAVPYDERFFSDASGLGDLVEIPEDGDILAQQAITMNVGDMLVFKLTVENYSDVPIRTTWPLPGTVYQQDQLAAAMGRNESSGAWRVGIECESSTNTYPYRWAIGGDDVLVTETGQTGEVFKYLPANSRSTVWGAIRFTDLNENFNPQTCYAGLIHEDVAVSERNSRVGPVEIELVDPNAGEE
ncbi:hypothetical protein G4Y79_12740 [Phototrophicus methaneseepsis]|uniref:Uncharacterized protein n=1 Tax=Phototrophicus methaneseepsis TaxID=2710758 RepID=A0A7S8ICR4_9CHLR|nr:hypothetical protein [Phototrophicus methaneseepsis]QPC80579.1 hypothetical protein G4Y79_12740 [Phototrophicus methaneseepsis]